MPNNSPELLPVVVQENNVLIDARLLHRKLKSGRQFTDWLKSRIKEYGFEERRDFFASQKNEAKRGGHNATDYLLTLDMAKELAMVERNDTGRAIRRYFIEKEKELRGLIALPGVAGLFTGIKPYRINNTRLFPYKSILERCGYSLKTGGSRRARYPQHFLLVGNNLYITEQFALHLHHQKQVMQNRVKLKESQPVLPLDFGTSSFTTKTKHYA